MDDDNELLDWGNEDDEQNQAPSTIVGDDGDNDDAVSLGDESEAESPPSTQRNDEEPSQTVTATAPDEAERPQTPAPSASRSRRPEDTQSSRNESPGRATTTTPGRLTHALPPKPAVVLAVPVVSTTAKATSMKAASGRSSTSRANDTPTLVAKNLASTTDSDLPPDWEILHSSKKEIYYWNTKTKESSWVRPTTSSSASDSRPRGESARAVTSSPTLAKRPPLSPHRVPSHREEPPKRVADTLSHDDRYYRPGENERLAREPRGSSRREEPRLTAADSSRDQHSSSRARLTEPPASESRREPAAGSRRGARDPEPSSGRHRRYDDEPDVSSSGPAQQQQRPVRYGYPTQEDNREDAWARAQQQQQHSDRSDARRPEPQSYNNNNSSQNESVAAPPRRRPSGSPPPTQRHPAAYPERRDDRREDLSDGPAASEARRRERASRFGPSKIEDPVQRPREYNYLPEAPRSAADEGRIRDSGGYPNEVMPSTDTRNGQREPPPPAPRDRQDDDHRRNGHIDRRPYDDYDRPHNGQRIDRPNLPEERYRPELERDASRMGGLATSSTSSRDSQRARNEIDIAPRGREPRQPRGARPAPMDVDTGPRREDPPPARYPGDAPPPDGPRWPKRGRSPLREAQGPPTVEADRSRPPPREPARPEPPLRTEPRRRRGEPKPTSGTNNIPITLDRYAIGQRKALSPEDALPPQGRTMENGDRELRNERAREPLPPGKESYERPQGREEPPRHPEPERGGRRPPSPVFERRTSDSRPLPPHMMGGRDRYRDDPQLPPPATRDDRNNAPHRTSDVNGYDRREDDRHWPGPPRDHYPREEAPRTISPRPRRRGDSLPRRERSPRSLDWDRERATRPEEREEAPRSARPPLSPARSRTSHSGAPRMVHPLPANPMLAKDEQPQRDVGPAQEPWRSPERPRRGSPSRRDGPARSPFETREVVGDPYRPTEGRSFEDERRLTISQNGRPYGQEPMDVDDPRMSIQDSLIDSPPLARTNSLLERLGDGPEKGHRPPLRERMADVPTSAGIKRDYTALDNDPRDDPHRRKKRGGRRAGGRR
ncbi:hypothetical protein BKA70DRAFT_1561685 [Coprinopsis sp. MPI-PUGE-AT-0042]|nr:hypothetical protein BKA70DRAFT_1561685 [Coprinopsis sp. MPI-PUGE-AT-0042]